MFHVLRLTAAISHEMNYLCGKAKFFLGKTSSKLQTNRILIWIATLENVIPRQRLRLPHQTIYQNLCTTCLGSLTGFGKKEKKLHYSSCFVYSVKYYFVVKVDNAGNEHFGVLLDNNLLRSEMAIRLIKHYCRTADLCCEANPGWHPVKYSFGVKASLFISQDLPGAIIVLLLRSTEQ